MSFPPVVRVMNTVDQAIPIEIVIPGTPPFPAFNTYRQGSGGVLITQQTIVSISPTSVVLLQVVAGYVADPNPANLYYVQLHDVDAVVNPGDVPKVVIPVYGGMLTYSYAVETEFNSGALQIALSTTQLTFTAPASDLLAFNAVGRWAP